MLGKKCLGCNLIKTFDSFYKGKLVGTLRSRCIECLKKERKTYCEENKDKRKAYQIVYQARATQRLRYRYHTDMAFRLSRIYRSRVRDALRNNGTYYKKRSGGNLLGCSFEEYKEYVTGLFTEGMSWDKLRDGQIHIDHKRPCMSFDLSDEGQRMACFHYTNTQPLWAKDNLIKSKKLTKCQIKSTTQKTLK